MSGQYIRPDNSDITATRFAAATKTRGCYNGRVKVVANLPPMRTCDAQAADSSENAALGRRSVLRLPRPSVCAALQQRLGRFAGSRDRACPRDERFGNVADMHPIDGADGVRMPQTPIESRVTPGSSPDA